MSSQQLSGCKSMPLDSIPSGWEVKRIDEFAPLQRGFDLLVDYIIPGEYPVVFSNGILKYHNEFKAKKPGVITGRSGTIGRVTYVENDYWPHNTALWVTDFKGNDPKFVYYTYVFMELERFGSGSGVPTLNRNDVHPYKILVPPLREQKLIAQLFILWDNAIEKTTQLISAKEQRKKWLMQQLLTGKKRLKGFTTEWQISSLAKFIKPIVREVEKPKESYLALGIRSHGKGTFLKPDEDPVKNEMETLFVVRENDLIVNITFAWEMAIAIVSKKDDGALVSHRFPTYTFIENHGCVNFFRFFMLRKEMKYALDLISPGGAGRNRVMSKTDFIKLQFLLPEYDEQVAIAEVLTAADKEINLLQQKLAAYKEQKKGLMQVLLTGKVRLKAN